jgi:hypothetical protein
LMAWSAFFRKRVGISRMLGTIPCLALFRNVYMRVSDLISNMITYPISDVICDG